MVQLPLPSVDGYPSPILSKALPLPCGPASCIVYYVMTESCSPATDLCSAYSAGFVELIHWMLQVEPHHRPSCTQIKERILQLLDATT